MAKKKSYNPFKMWGSYVGAVMGSILGFLLLSSLQVGIGTNSLWGGLFFSLNRPLELIEILFFATPGLILGFLLGYAIHATVRSIKK